MKKRLAALVTTVVMVVSMPVAALAHECLNANRSDTGSQNSAHGKWLYISEEEVVGFVSDYVDVDPAEVGEAFLSEVEAQGLPTSFSIFVGKLILGANPTTGEFVAAYQDSEKSADGKGIDHINALFESYVAIMRTVSG